MKRAPAVHSGPSAGYLITRTAIVALSSLLTVVPPVGADEPAPDVLIISIDTLRADHLSSYGYQRPTSPHIDRLVLGGAQFLEARTVQGFTAPAFCSLWTSMYPHRHGSSRNGLKMRPGLNSLAKTLDRNGYRTAAIISNWVVKPRMSGLDEHFDEYLESFSRKQWGIVRPEGRADKVTDAAAGWLRAATAVKERPPFLLWVLYIDPHNPYLYHEEYAGRLGIESRNPTKPERYDTEIAFTDQEVGRLLEVAGELIPGDRLITVFLSDHGESLGEHGYWGHGHDLYDPGLRIPLSVTWPGQIRAQQLTSPANIVDVAPTVLGLLDLEAPPSFVGYDFSGVLLDGEPEPTDRTTYHQAHKGLVIIKRGLEKKRRGGLTQVAIVQAGKKEIYRVGDGERLLFDLDDDPGELESEVDPGSQLSKPLLQWMGKVYDGLDALDKIPVKELDEESIEKLRALGYVE